MSNLTGQQINQTYPGLLNLATATTGVTTTPQQIQDGLGNDTGAQIATNFFAAPNLFPMNKFTNFTPDYMGPGINSVALAPQANQQNTLNALMFYDSGKYAYSAFTYILLTATTTTDVVEVAFYNTQYSDSMGVVPYQLIMSGITLTTSPGSTALLSTTLPSTLSFSGTGGGYYYMVMKISNSGVTPTLRFTTNPSLSAQSPFLVGPMLGLVRNRSGNALVPGIGTNNVQVGYTMTATNFKETFTTADGAINTGVNAYLMGFALKTIK